MKRRKQSENFFCFSEYLLSNLRTIQASGFLLSRVTYNLNMRVNKSSFQQTYELQIVSEGQNLKEYIIYDKDDLKNISNEIQKQLVCCNKQANFSYPMRSKVPPTSIQISMSDVIIFPSLLHINFVPNNALQMFIVQSYVMH